MAGDENEVSLLVDSQMSPYEPPKRNFTKQVTAIFSCLQGGLIESWPGVVIKKEFHI